jgi:hypothetical protein
MTADGGGYVLGPRSFSLVFEILTDGGKSEGWIA